MDCRDVHVFGSTETIFTGARTQDRLFWIVAFVPVISSPKQKFCIGSLVLSSPGLEFQDRFFGVMSFVPIISLSEQTIFVLAPLISHAKFPSYRNHPLWDSNPGLFFGVSTVLKSLLGFNKCQVWCKLVYPFKSFKRKKTHTHTRTITFVQSFQKKEGKQSVQCLVVSLGI